MLFRRILYILLLLPLFISACSTYQPVKNVWKSTKGFWNTYVSTPATVNYESKGDLSPQSVTLAASMKGIDEELSKLERAMQNADKPPTQEWLDNLFAAFPWLSGFAGIKYDGTILGQQPAESMKELDFNRLLYEDKKQRSRALRADVQPSPLGPEIMLATPLYDSTDFLGVVVAYFDMRSLMRFSSNPQEIVILCPSALLWPGKYEFAATPLAGVNWENVVRESSAGTCANNTGSFFYMVRYLGNLPLVFAIPETGNFPEGDGGLEQAANFFPQEREKMAPPPLPERKPRRETETRFAQRADEEEEETAAPLTEEPAQAQKRGRAANEITPGSADSVLLKSASSRGRQLEERQLEGENVPVERVERQRQPKRQIIIPEPVEVEPEPDIAPPVQRPSPFGPREDEAAQREEAPAQREETFVSPSPFGPPPGAEEKSVSPADNARPAAETPEVEPAPAPAVEEKSAAESGEGQENTTRMPARMKDGRPSPFGPSAD